MSVLERIKDRIGAFAGYETADGRRLADEQVRAYAGERLAALGAGALEALKPEERERYDRVLLRCEFRNQQTFSIFETGPGPQRIAALLDADALLLDAAASLQASGGPNLGARLRDVEAAFEKRDSAMTA
ncbi:MAG: hypothetical protein ABR508_01185 [Candidatus Baltobacteraceae bacterium]